MMRFRRLAVLLVPLVVGLVSLAFPGRAQTPAGRYAFADTTLLRDTLGLTFDELFPLADSLRVTPDTLRALSIRLRAPLRAIVRLADSLAVPLDSVSAVLERERFNPLAATRASRSVDQFNYSTTYDIQRTASGWNNDSRWSHASRSLVLNNTTSVNLARTRAGNGITLQQTRTSTTEAGWRFSPDFSAGGRLILYRYNLSYPVAGGGDDVATRNETQVSLRFRGRPHKNLSADLNFFPGLLDLNETRQVKRGVSGDLNGRLRYTQGNVFTHDLSARMTGNVARTGLPTSSEVLRTRDFSRGLDGTMSLFSAARLGANMGYRVRHSVVQTPLDSGRVQQLVNENNGADLTIRGRLDNDRQLNLGGRISNTRTAQQGSLITGSAQSSYSTARTLSMDSDARYRLFGVNLEGQFRTGLTVSRYPTRFIVSGSSAGYGESTRVAAIQVSASRGGSKLTLRAKGSAELSRSRVFKIGAPPSSPVNRDAYHQDYRLEANYVASDDLNTGVALNVGRSLAINIPKENTGSNSETRSYGAEWRWSYRLFPDLTAIQYNGITAEYLRYSYRPKDSRLTMLYRTTTTLNAVLSSRFSFDVSHSATYQPGGNYAVQPDGLEAFSLADQNRTYSLRSNLSYRPAPALALSFSPNYNASRRHTTTNGVLAPSRGDRSFDFTGRATLDVPLGRRGKLTGNIARSTNSTAQTVWSGDTQRVLTGLPVGYWNGSLQLSWDL